ncbi:MAG: hypothetical protein SFT94_05685 [Pseudanabaenaceae cyanobacterium bins.68]|nr:hypothetical protein [Pseudanabaenaceae cyanobacterium bins.68]
MSIDAPLAKANARLKALKISIQVKGARLLLQATLPPKPVPGVELTAMERATQKWKQQKIYLQLRANEEGVRLAEAKAREISGYV